jgi:D-alanine-D-alanine ligase
MGVCKVFEVLGLPYVGSGVLASALGCDKIVAKIVFQATVLPVAEEVDCRAVKDLARAAQVRREIGRAVVVKPHAQGRRSV